MIASNCASPQAGDIQYQGSAICIPLRCTLRPLILVILASFVIIALSRFRRSIRSDEKVRPLVQADHTCLPTLAPEVRHTLGARRSSANLLRSHRQAQANRRPFARSGPKHRSTIAMPRICLGHIGHGVSVLSTLGPWVCARSRGQSRGPKSANVGS